MNPQQKEVPSRCCLSPVVRGLLNHIICLKSVVNRSWGDPRLAEVSQTREGSFSKEVSYEKWPPEDLEMCLISIDMGDPIQ